MKNGVGVKPFWAKQSGPFYSNQLHHCQCGRTTNKQTHQCTEIFPLAKTGPEFSYGFQAPIS